MKTDEKKSFGVRIAVGQKGEKNALFLNRTVNSGKAQNAKHKLVQPPQTEIISDLDPVKIGKAVLKMLDLK